MQYKQEIEDVARTEIQDVAREKIAKLQEKIESTSFKLAALKRQDITSWITESWRELCASTLVSGFAKADLLGDTRSARVAEEQEEAQDIDAVLDGVADLSPAGESVDSDDDFFCSDSSDGD